MEITDGVLRIGPFIAVTLGIIVLFVGKRVNDIVAFLREFSIPQPVTGGILFSMMFGIVYATTGVAVEFNLAARSYTSGCDLFVPSEIVVWHMCHRDAPPGRRFGLGSARTKRDSEIQRQSPAGRSGI